MAVPLSSHGLADTPYPRDMPILTLVSAEGARHHLSLDMLEVLPLRTVEGRLPNVSDTTALWQGVSLRVLLAHYDLPLPSRFKASALNGYSDIIPVQDIDDYDPIVAYQRKGEYLSISELGPLVIMYPYGDHPELSVSQYHSRTVWQLNELYLK
ncbi:MULTISPECIES: oxidoreductase [Halomonadaceae]|uniref:oxidoreductase n=1 Tax=Halomonadaceae TaxID=28256 RepID=UPI001599E6B3|nr:MULTISPECIES: oxidoreductase [Halomonas]QJQ95849.1 oxidoreductase [Halomonas sp. PA5]